MATHSNAASLAVIALFQTALQAHQTGRLAEADHGYRQVLAIDPRHADALRLLGLVACQLKGNLNEGLTHISRALAIREDPLFLVDIGNIFLQAGEFLKAEAPYLRAVELNPGYADAHYNLGVLYRNMARLEDAEKAFRTVLKLHPQDFEAQANLGNTLRDVGRLDEALDCYRAAQEISPQDAQLHTNIGTVQQAIGKLAEAAQSYRTALKLNPKLAFAYSNLGSVLLDLGQVAESVSSLKKAIALQPEFMRARSNLIVSYNYLPDLPPESLLAEAVKFGQVAAANARPFKEWNVSKEPERKLRIGLVSGRFASGPVGYFLEGTLASIKARRSEEVEFIGYTNHFLADNMTNRIRQNCVLWRQVHTLSDMQFAQLVFSDQVDILIDLAGHSPNNRLTVFAWRPAPIQITWLDYFATTGMPGVNYLIADPWLLRPDDERFFTERIYRLPQTRLCFTPPDIPVPVSDLPAQKNRYVTFGCFNNLVKVTDSVVALWSRILESTPNSRLVLMAPQLIDPNVINSLAQRFADSGVARDRIVLQAPLPRKEYLEAYGQIDIVLDPFPFTGATTTAEALWMGVPVLTLAGDRFVARQGVSLLMNVGLPEWVCNSEEDYLDKAQRYASDIEQLTALRKKLREQLEGSPVCDAKLFAQKFLDMLRTLWTTEYCCATGAHDAHQFVT